MRAFEACACACAAHHLPLLGDARVGAQLHAPPQESAQRRRSAEAMLDRVLLAEPRRQRARPLQRHLGRRGEQVQWRPAARALQRDEAPACAGGGEYCASIARVLREYCASASFRMFVCGRSCGAVKGPRREGGAWAARGPARRLAAGGNTALFGTRPAASVPAMPSTTPPRRTAAQCLWPLPCARGVGGPRAASGRRVRDFSQFVDGVGHGQARRKVGARGGRRGGKPSGPINADGSTGRAGPGEYRARGWTGHIEMRRGRDRGDERRL